jgi:hypothetical protein
VERAGRGERASDKDLEPRIDFRRVCRRPCCRLAKTISAWVCGGAAGGSDRSAAAPVGGARRARPPTSSSSQRRRAPSVQLDLDSVAVGSSGRLAAAQFVIASGVGSRCRARPLAASAGAGRAERAARRGQSDAAAPAADRLIC